VVLNDQIYWLLCERENAKYTWNIFSFSPFKRTFLCWFFFFTGVCNVKHFYYKQNHFIRNQCIWTAKIINKFKTLVGNKFFIKERNLASYMSLAGFSHKVPNFHQLIFHVNLIFYNPLTFLDEFQVPIFLTISYIL